MLKNLVLLEMQWAQPVALLPNTDSSKGPAVRGATLSISCRKRRNCSFRNRNRNFYQLLLKYPQKYLTKNKRQFFSCLEFSLLRWEYPQLFFLAEELHQCLCAVSLTAVSILAGLFFPCHELLWELTSCEQNLKSHHCVRQLLEWRLCTPFYLTGFV